MSVMYHLITLVFLAYSISTVVYIHNLHDVPAHTPCKNVLPGLRDFLRIGGWVILGVAILANIAYGAPLVPMLPALLRQPLGCLLILAFVAVAAVNVAIPILTIQYTNALRTTPASSDVGACLRRAPYRREIIDGVAWFNIALVAVGLAGMAFGVKPPGAGPAA